MFEERPAGLPLPAEGERVGVREKDATGLL
jgi:hypothetical protein